MKSACTMPTNRVALSDWRILAFPPALSPCEWPATEFCGAEPHVFVSPVAARTILTEEKPTRIPSRPQVVRTMAATFGHRRTACDVSRTFVPHELQRSFFLCAFMRWRLFFSQPSKPFLLKPEDPRIEQQLSRGRQVPLDARDFSFSSPLVWWSLRPNETLRGDALTPTAAPSRHTRRRGVSALASFFREKARQRQGTRSRCLV